jgi:thiosulfate reductase cytochrome b subunit
MGTRDSQRHSTTTRITHWGTAASFVLLFASGAAIYDHRPTFRFGSHTLTLPRIPSWLTLSASPKLVHYVFAAIFVLCGIFYLAWGLRNGHFKDLMLKRADVANLIPMHLYYLGLRNEPPPYGRYNPLQKLAYSVVLFVIVPLIVVSGAALMPMLHPIGIIFVGGVKLWHFALMWVLCLFIIIHVGMVLATGLVKNIRAMITGSSEDEVVAFPIAMEPIKVAGRAARRYSAAPPIPSPTISD